MTARWRPSIRRGLKRVVDAVCLAVVAPCAALSAIEAGLTDHGESVFAFWTHVFALAPGVPGGFLRRAFYRLTLD